MTKTFGRKDLRVIKTRRSLREAMAALLERRPFKHITVNDLCEEALMSRAAFYAHFYDKYDLLEYYLGGVAGEYLVAKTDTADAIAGLIAGTQRVRIRNILISADSETAEIVNKFIASLVNAAPDDGSPVDPARALLIDFWVGGIIQFIMRQTAATLSLGNKDQFVKLMRHFAELKKVL